MAGNEDLDNQQAAEMGVDALSEGRQGGEARGAAAAPSSPAAPDVPRREARNRAKDNRKTRRDPQGRDRLPENKQNKKAPLAGNAAPEVEKEEPHWGRILLNLIRGAVTGTSGVSAGKRDAEDKEPPQSAEQKDAMWAKVNPEMIGKVAEDLNRRHEGRLFESSQAVMRGREDILNSLGAEDADTFRSRGVDQLVREGGADIKRDSVKEQLVEMHSHLDKLSEASGDRLSAISLLEEKISNPAAFDALDNATQQAGAHAEMQLHEAEQACRDCESVLEKLDEAVSLSQHREMLAQSVAPRLETPEQGDVAPTDQARLDAEEMFRAHERVEGVLRDQLSAGQDGDFEDAALSGGWGMVATRSMEDPVYAEAFAQHLYEVAPPGGECEETFESMQGQLRQALEASTHELEAAPGTRSATDPNDPEHPDYHRRKAALEGGASVTELSLVDDLPMPGSDISR